MPVSRRRKAARAAVALVVLAVLPVAGFIAWRQSDGNFGVVQPGRVYRAGQMGGEQIGRKVREFGVKTVLNLRGTNPDEAWYRAEKRAVLDAGATLVDIPMASDLWLSRPQARRLLDVLDDAEYPILVHCQWGSERTGLVSAIVELLRPGAGLDDARGQFALHYLFLPVRDGPTMRGHVDRYAAALAARGEGHSPDRFRRWVLEEYRPGSPSREEWPYDPYPLSVVHRPPSDPPPPADSAGGASGAVARKPGAAPDARR